MLNRVLPPRIDNNYTGLTLALWLFGFVALIRSVQSIEVIFNGYQTVSMADGIPLSTYPPGAAQTVLAAFASGSLYRLFLCIVCAVVLWRYRSAVPAMFVLLIAHFVAAQVLFQILPLNRVGNPPGVIMNRIVLGLMVVGFALSLLPSRHNRSQEAAV